MERLSMEDEGDKDESNSIVNQREQIHEYISQDSELSGYEVKEFCDDGYSGAGMDRPGMQKLLKEIKENKIRCIIVKDMCSVWVQKKQRKEKQDHSG